MDATIGAQNGAAHFSVEPTEGAELLLNVAQGLGLTAYGECYAAAHLCDVARTFGYAATCHRQASLRTLFGLLERGVSTHRLIQSNVDHSPCSSWSCRDVKWPALTIYVCVIGAISEPPRLAWYSVWLGGWHGTSDTGNRGGGYQPLEFPAVDGERRPAHTLCRAGGLFRIASGGRGCSRRGELRTAATWKSRDGPSSVPRYVSKPSYVSSQAKRSQAKRARTGQKCMPNLIHSSSSVLLFLSTSRVMIDLEIEPTAHELELEAEAQAAWAAEWAAQPPDQDLDTETGMEGEAERKSGSTDEPGSGSAMAASAVARRQEGRRRRLQEMPTPPLPIYLLVKQSGARAPVPSIGTSISTAFPIEEQNIMLALALACSCFEHMIKTVGFTIRFRI